VRWSPDEVDERGAPLASHRASGAVSTPTASRWPVVALALGVTWAAVVCALCWPWDVDDAFILFRYGRHLATGQGLAWNPGGPPVEGYTDLLYVLLSAGLLRLGADPLVPLKVLGFVCFAAMAWLAARFSRALGGSSTEGTLASVGLLAAPGLALWAVSGLETTLFGALLLFAAVRFAGDTARDDVLAALALLFAALARTEAPVWALLFVLLRAWTARATPRRLLPWLAFVAPYALFFVWRAAYFGQLVPNPVLFKSTLAVEGGAESVLVPFAGAWSPWLLLAALGLARTRRWLPALIAVLAVPVFITATTTAHDATTMSFFDRYLLPVVPAVVVLAVEPLAALLARSRPAGLALVAALLGWTAFNPFVSVRAVGSLALSASRNVRPATRALAAFLEARGPGFRVALGDVGTVGYLFHGAIDDLYGLNEPVYTRRCRGNLGCWADELLARAPDAFVLVMRGAQTAHEVERRVLEHPGFATRYHRTREFRAGDNPWAFVVYERTP
jgi:hypothetical protein